jgi:hypothetical protein
LRKKLDQAILDAIVCDSRSFSDFGKKGKKRLKKLLIKSIFYYLTLFKESKTFSTLRFQVIMPLIEIQSKKG